MILALLAEEWKAIVGCVGGCHSRWLALKASLDFANLAKVSVCTEYGSKTWSDSRRRLPQRGESVIDRKSAPASVAVAGRLNRDAAIQDWVGLL